MIAIVCSLEGGAQNMQLESVQPQAYNNNFGQPTWRGEHFGLDDTSSKVSVIVVQSCQEIDHDFDLRHI